MLEAMEHIHRLQNRYALSDLAWRVNRIRLHEIASMCLVAWLMALGPVVDETIMLNFRRPLETLCLAALMLDAVRTLSICAIDRRY